MKTISLHETSDEPFFLTNTDQNILVTLAKNVHACVVHQDASGTIQFILEEDSSLLYYCVHTTQEKTAALQQHIQLRGKHSQVKIVNLFYHAQEEQNELTTHIEHLAPSTESLLLTRGIVKDKAKNTFKGLITIAKQASDAKGKQESKVLTFEEAQAYSIPELDIENNQVQCSHGSSVGQVDQEKLFYLQSRGLSEEEAQTVFIQGFYEPLLQSIAHPIIQDFLRKALAQRL